MRRHNDSLKNALDKDFSTRWHSELNVLEKYTVLRLYLARALSAGALKALEESDEECVAECVYVLQEVRRFARALEAERHVSGTRVPRLLSELNDTLDIFGEERSTRRYIQEHLRGPRVSSAGDDRALLASRQRIVRDKKTRLLAREMRENIHERMGHFFVRCARGRVGAP